MLSRLSATEHVLTKRGEHVVKILFINETITILVDHVECLLEFLNLGLVEHSEDIRSGALRAFLRRSATASGLPGRHLRSFVT